MIEEKEKGSPLSVVPELKEEIERKVRTAFSKLEKPLGFKKAITVLKELHQGGVADATKKINEDAKKNFSVTQQGEVVARIASNGDVEITRMLEGIDKAETEKIKMRVVTTIIGNNKPSSEVYFQIYSKTKETSAEETVFENLEHTEQQNAIKEIMKEVGDMKVGSGTITMDVNHPIVEKAQGFTHIHFKEGTGTYTSSSTEETVNFPCKAELRIDCATQAVEVVVFRQDKTLENLEKTCLKQIQNKRQIEEAKPSPRRWFFRR